MNKLQEYHARLEREFDEKVNTGQLCPNCFSTQVLVKDDSVAPIRNYVCKSCGRQWDSNFLKPRGKKL